MSILADSGVRRDEQKVAVGGGGAFRDLRRFAQLAAVAVLCLAASACVPEPQGDGGYGGGSGYDRGSESDSELFYDALAPYGQWVDHETYGRVWYPSNVPMGWRPYTDGHWEYSLDYGWVWASDWAWGWAPFHYGRWAFDDWYGWVWVPGRVWAPAWVFWRYGGGYAAWAPMPPTVYWRPGRGLDRRYFNDDRDLRWDSWVCVPEQHLYGREMRRHIFDLRDNPRMLERARTMVPVASVGNRVVNQGVPVGYVEKLTGRRVSPVRLHEVGRPDGRADYFDRDGLRMVRPRFRSESARDLDREAAQAAAASRVMDREERDRSRREGAKDRFEPRKAGRFDQKAGSGKPKPVGERTGPVPQAEPVSGTGPAPREDDRKFRQGERPLPPERRQLAPAGLTPSPERGPGPGGDWERDGRRPGAEGERPDAGQGPTRDGRDDRPRIAPPPAVAAPAKTGPPQAVQAAPPARKPAPPAVEGQIVPEQRRDGERRRDRRPSGDEQMMPVERPASPDLPHVAPVRAPQQPVAPEVRPPQEEPSLRLRERQRREPAPDQVQPREGVFLGPGRPPRQEMAAPRPQPGAQEQPGAQDKRKKKRRAPDGSELPETEDQPPQ